MGLFDHFPYTNVHELNLDWVLSMMKALEAEWEAFTAGNSLIFADPMLHDVTKTYAKNTIVLDGIGNAYVSLQAVPVGVALGNQDYWLMVFDYEAFIEKVNKNFTARYYRGSYRATAAMDIGDWLTVDDVLCKATAAIAVDDVLQIGVNIEHFTLEDFIKAFMQSANQLIQQYKYDIDQSEIQYRNTLAQDIANTTASLQAQLDAAIAGATVDSEVINARIGWDSTTYPTLGDAIRTQITNIMDVMGVNGRNIYQMNITISSIGSTTNLSDLAIGTLYTYTIDATSSGFITDLPTPMQNNPNRFFILTFSGDWRIATAKGQIIFDITNSKIYWRSGWGSLGAWVEMARFSDIPLIDASLSISGQAADAYSVGTRTLNSKNIITSVGSSLTLGDYKHGEIYSFAISASDAANITDLPSDMAGVAARFTIMTFFGAWNFISGKVQVLYNMLTNDMYMRSCWGTYNTWKKFADDSKQLINISGNLTALPTGVTTLADLPNNTVYTFRLAPADVAAITDMPAADTQFTIMTFNGDSGFPAKCQIFMGMNNRKDIYMRALWGGQTLGWQYINEPDPNRRTNIYLGYTTSPDGVIATGFVDAVTKASAYEYPTIHIAEGVYDIYTELGGSTYFSDTSHTDQPYIIPANCEIIGHGRVVLSLEVPDAVAATNSTLMLATSIIHTNGTGLKLKDLILKAKNIRYNIHDESSAMGWTTILDSQHIFENVKCIASNNGYGHGSNYGCGTASGGTYIFDGCIFINNVNDNMHIHNWYNSKGERLIFKDCGFNGNAYSIGLGVHGTAICDVEIENCFAETDMRIYSEAGTYTENCYDVAICNSNINPVVQSSITVDNLPTTYVGARP